MLSAPSSRSQVIVLAGLIGVSLFTFSSFAQAATLSTDKGDYFPGETAYITGSEFEAQRDVTLTIVGYNEDSSEAVNDSWDVQADDIGAFLTSWTLPDFYVPLYLLAATEDGEILAETTFTDAAPTLNVSRSGSGSGTVTSSDGSINCGGTCSHTYGSNPSITINAVADPDSTFVGWSGDCSGSTTPCSPGHLSGNQTSNVTATFNLVVVEKLDQTIAFDALDDKTYGDADFEVSASSDSGLTVTFGFSGDCTMAGNIVHITGAGSCTITASQAGNDYYNSATDVDRSFDIDKASLTVTADDQEIIYGDADPTFTFEYDGFVNSEGESVIDTSPTCDVAGVHTDAGSYSIDCSGGSDTNYDFIYVSGTLTINKADAVCEIVGYAVLYDGSPHSVDSDGSASCTGVNGKDLSTELDLSATEHTAAGAYTDPWTFHDPNGNYEDISDTVDNVIIGVLPPITVSNKDFKKGSTIPVKIPSTIGDWTIYLRVCKGGSEDCSNAVSSGNSNIENEFRFDEAGEKYIYNLSTKLTTIFADGKTGHTFDLWITIEPDIITEPFNLATITIK